jgi:hypothetical protein
MEDKLQTYTKRKRIFLILSIICIVAPLIIFGLRGFILGTTVQKWTFAFTTAAAILFTIINVLMKAQFRSAVWVVLYGICVLIQNITPVILTLMITSLIEEIILWPAYKHYKLLEAEEKHDDKLVYKIKKGLE